MTMPLMAAVIATTVAPLTPACSNSGANARPVAGPPVSVTEPASTPSSGGRPMAAARPAPSTFCSSAATVEMARNHATCTPPTRSRRRLAPKPMVVKKAIISGACSVVSKRTRSCPSRRSRLTMTATSSPPSTGAGRS